MYTWCESGVISMNNTQNVEALFLLYVHHHVNDVYSPNRRREEAALHDASTVS